MSDRRYTDREKLLKIFDQFGDQKIYAVNVLEGPYDEDSDDGGYLLLYQDHYKFSHSEGMWVSAGPIVDHKIEKTVKANIQDRLARRFLGGLVNGSDDCMLYEVPEEVYQKAFSMGVEFGRVLKAACGGEQGVDGA